jgi:hypothetical protein
MVGCMDGMWGLRSFFRLRRRAREPRIRVVEASERASERERERERAGGERERGRTTKCRRICTGEKSASTNTILTDFFLAVFGEFIWRLSGKKAFVEEEIRYASLSVFPLINPSLQEESSC